MKLSAVFVSALFVFADVVVARPSRLQERVLARQRSSRPLEGGLVPTNNTHSETSTNWSGAVLTSPPTGQTFNGVVGTFVVPTPSGTGSASAWVGIDGDTAQNSILQAGIDFTVSGGKVSYDSWYEWYPDYAYDFSNFAVSAGNTITITITASSSTAGVVTLKNVSTGKSVSKSLTAPSSSSALEGLNAEWIVEDYEENGSLVTLTNWGTVTFTGASASTASETVGVSDATIINMEQNSKVLTSVTIPSDSSVVIAHT